MRLLDWIPQGLERRSYRDSLPWRIAALALGAAAGVRAVAEGFFGPLENVPDDARQFMFWMQRWFDPALFQHDVIADYFESVAPVGAASRTSPCQRITAAMTPRSFKTIRMLMATRVTA